MSSLNITQNSNNVDVYEIFACGHNLGMFKNHPVGDPLELKIFEQTKCTIEDSQQNNNTKLILPHQDDQ